MSGRFGSEPRRRNRRTTIWGGRLAVALGLVAVTIGVITPAAWASYGRIEAEARCDRVVSWVASASSEGSAKQRSNKSVEVAIKPAGSNSAWKTVETDAFTAENGFTFSGSTPLPPKVDSVEVMVQPMSKWGDGSAAGSPKYAVATVDEKCASFPVTAVIQPNCSFGGAVVSMRNLADSPTTMRLSVDRVVVREAKLTPNGSTDLKVPVLDGTSSVIRVNVDDFVVAQRKVDADCDSAGPQATILERCPSHQAVVTARSNSESNKSVEVRVDGTIVKKAALSTNETLRQTIEFPAESTHLVAVEINGTTAAEAEMGDCTTDVTGAASCGATGRPACEAASTPPEMTTPPTPPPPLVLDLHDGTLPMTGPWQKAIVLILGGALLMGGGLLLMAEERRRPKPSVLGSAVADYRPLWWDNL